MSVLDLALSKAVLSDPNHRIADLTVPYNPNTLQYSISDGQGHDKGVHFPASGKAEPQIPVFQNDPTHPLGTATLSVTLFFHTYQSSLVYSDVRTELKRLHQFFRHTSGNGGGDSPNICFTWGSMTFTGVLTSLSITYKMFAPDGTPVQAEATISLLGRDNGMESEALTASAMTEAASALQGVWSSFKSATNFLFGR